ncbi:hypothetical protein PVAP13_5KG622307 [Panicum virgatum]|uniref:Uncharacterized protein n=1 Tax=Panicum virgatum TaxID=38727 RepID=A0A8T0SX25_PANVG|nr:hypothetical protein PVAP13_5KG622307 [Panicum virgatum]
MFAFPLNRPKHKSLFVNAVYPWRWRLASVVPVPRLLARRRSLPCPYHTPPVSPGHWHCTCALAAPWPPARLPTVSSRTQTGLALSVPLGPGLAHAPKLPPVIGFGVGLGSARARGLGVGGRGDRKIASLLAVPGVATPCDRARAGTQPQVVSEDAAGAACPPHQQVLPLPLLQGMPHQSESSSPTFGPHGSDNGSAAASDKINEAELVGKHKLEEERGNTSATNPRGFELEIARMGGRPEVEEAEFRTNTEE